MRAASKIVRDNMLYGIGVGIVVDDYKKIKYHFPKTVEGLKKDPYLFCAHECLESCARWAYENNYTDSMRFVFEQGDNYQYQILDAYNQALKDTEKRDIYKLKQGSLTFASDNCFTPLQAADFLAHELYKDCKRIIEKKDTRKSLRKLLNIKGDYRMFSGENLIEYLNDYSEYLRQKASC
jgi:hypothetical protein